MVGMHENGKMGEVYPYRSDKKSRLAGIMGEVCFAESESPDGYRELRYTRQ
jgi:hypothetical protein